MEKDSIFNTLDNKEVAIAKRKQILNEYLREQLAYRKQHIEKSEDIAYGIAGLLATELSMTLPSDDPYEEVLFLAGQLELPEDVRSEDATWEELARLIEQLPR